jgi:hypothetical protein
VKDIALHKSVRDCPGTSNKAECSRRQWVDTNQRKREKRIKERTCDATQSTAVRCLTLDVLSVDGRRHDVRHSFARSTRLTQRDEYLVSDVRWDARSSIDRTSQVLLSDVVRQPKDASRRQRQQTTRVLAEKIIRRKQPFTDRLKSNCP